MPRNTLTVAVAQTEILVGDVVGNATGQAEVVRAAGARLVVLPELSLTGYDVEAASLDLADPALDVLVRACREVGSVALVGAPISEDGGDFIATLRVDQDGVPVAARKVWVHGAEHDRFRGGPEAAVIDVDGWTVGLAICFDTNVQRHTAQLARRGVDLYVAGVLDGPGQEDERVARTFLTARALRAPVAISHYRGATPLFPTTVGTSMMADANREILAAVSDPENERFVVATVRGRAQS